MVTFSSRCLNVRRQVDCSYDTRRSKARSQRMCFSTFFGDENRLSIETEPEIPGVFAPCDFFHQR